MGSKAERGGLDRQDKVIFIKRQLVGLTANHKGMLHRFRCPFCAEVNVKKTENSV